MEIGILNILIKSTISKPIFTQKCCRTFLWYNNKTPSKLFNCPTQKFEPTLIEELQLQLNSLLTDNELERISKLFLRAFWHKNRKLVDIVLSKHLGEKCYLKIIYIVEQNELFSFVAFEQNETFQRCTENRATKLEKKQNQFNFFLIFLYSSQSWNQNGQTTMSFTHLLAKFVQFININVNIKTEPNITVINLHSTRD